MTYALPCDHPDAYVSPIYGRQHNWEVFGEGADKRFKCTRCGYPDVHIASAADVNRMIDAVRVKPKDAPDAQAKPGN